MTDSKDTEIQETLEIAQASDDLPTDPPFIMEDRLGRTWDLTLTMEGAKLIDRADYSEITDLEFSILEPTKQVFLRVLTDGPLVLAMIWAMVQEQAEEKCLSPKDEAGNFREDEEAQEKAQLAFLRGFDGPHIRKDKTVFWRAVCDFFPDHKTGLLVLEGKLERSQQKLAEQIQGLEPEIDQMLDSLIGPEIQKGMDGLRAEVAKLRSGQKSTKS